MGAIGTGAVSERLRPSDGVRTYRTRSAENSREVASALPRVDVQPSERAFSTAPYKSSIWCAVAAATPAWAVLPS